MLLPCLFIVLPHSITLPLSMQTRWLSVIKSRDTALIKSPLYKMMGVRMYDLAIQYVFYCECGKINKIIKSEGQNREKNNTLACIHITLKLLSQIWANAHCKGAACAQTEKDWGVWGRVCRMRSYWDNWLLPGNNGRIEDSHKTFVCLYTK